MTYEAWRISYQSAEQAARAAYRRAEELAAKLGELEQQEPIGWVFVDDPAVFAMPGTGYHAGKTPPRQQSQMVPTPSPLPWETDHEKVTVSAGVLRQVLQALNGPGYRIAELQTRR